jgi:hypothetical protein
MAKTFIAYWGDGYGEPYAEIFDGLDHFIEHNNYTNEDREALDNLGLLCSLNLSDICGTHYITRVK